MSFLIDPNRPFSIYNATHNVRSRHFLTKTVVNEFQQMEHPWRTYPLCIYIYTYNVYIFSIVGTYKHITLCCIRIIAYLYTRRLRHRRGGIGTRAYILSTLMNNLLYGYTYRSVRRLNFKSFRSVIFSHFFWLIFFLFYYFYYSIARLVHILPPLLLIYTSSSLTHTHTHILGRSRPCCSRGTCKFCKNVSTHLSNHYPHLGRGND